MRITKVLAPPVAAGTIGLSLLTAALVTASIVIPAVTAGPPDPEPIAYADLIDRATGTKQCGGVLVSNVWVLTAASCLTTIAPGTSHHPPLTAAEHAWAGAGATRPRKPDDGENNNTRTWQIHVDGATREIKKIARHPQFLLGVRQIPGEGNDLALVAFDPPATARPIWPDALPRDVLRGLPAAECARGGITDDELCLAPAGDGGACGSNSGRPLIWSHLNPRLVALYSRPTPYGCDGNQIVTYLPPYAAWMRETIDRYAPSGPIGGAVTPLLRTGEPR